MLDMAKRREDSEPRKRHRSSLLVESGRRAHVTLVRWTIARRRRPPRFDPCRGETDRVRTPSSKRHLSIMYYARRGANGDAYLPFDAHKSSEHERLAAADTQHRTTMAEKSSSSMHHSRWTPRRARPQDPTPERGGNRQASRARVPARYGYVHLSGIAALFQRRLITRSARPIP